VASATNKAVREFFRNYGKIRTALLLGTPPMTGRGGCGKRFWKIPQWINTKQPKKNQKRKRWIGNFS